MCACGSTDDSLRAVSHLSRDTQKPRPSCVWRHVLLQASQLCTQRVGGGRSTSCLPGASSLQRIKTQSASSTLFFLQILPKSSWSLFFFLFFKFVFTSENWIRKLGASVRFLFHWKHRVFVPHLIQHHLKLSQSATTACPPHPNIAGTVEPQKRKPPITIKLNRMSSFTRYHVILVPAMQTQGTREEAGTAALGENWVKSKAVRKGVWKEQEEGEREREREGGQRSGAV